MKSLTLGGILVGIGVFALLFIGGGYGLVRAGAIKVNMFPSDVQPCSWSIEATDADGRVVRYCPQRMN